MAGAALAPGRAHEVIRAPAIYRAAASGYTGAGIVMPGAKRVASFTFRRQLTVEWGHCDPAGIVFNPHFFEFFDASTWLLFEAALGVKAQELTTVYGILGIALVDARANFLKPARFGDAVEIASRVSAFRRASFDVEHRLSVNGALAVEGGESRVWAVRRKDDPDRIRAAPIPQEVITRFT
jgi:4-hydroxybenzoyl-CoA thioesterase